MKKTSFSWSGVDWLVVLVCIFLLLPFAVQARSTVFSNPSSDRIRVGSDQDYPPYEFNDERGEPSGFNVELIKAVCEAAGLQADIRLGVWNEIRSGLEKGKIDVIAGMYFSSERSRTFDFSVPHNMVSSGLFVRNDSEIRTFEQARDKEIIVQKGDIMHDYLVEQGFTGQVVIVDNPIQALKLLASGKHDAVLLSSKIQGLYFLHQNRIQHLRVVETHLPARKYCFAVGKNNAEILQRLNEGLNILKHTGKYRQLYEKWFGVYEEKPIWQTSKVFVMAFITILVLLVFISVITAILRLQVKKRTRELVQSQERYRHLVQNAGDILYTTDDKGNILYINPMAEIVMGYRAEEMIGKRFLEFIPPDYQNEVNAFYQRQYVQKENNAYHELPLLTKNNHIVWIGQNTQLLEHDGNIMGFQAIARDISDRKRMDDELQLTRKRLSRAEIISCSGNWEFDLVSNRVFASEGARQIYGLSDGEWTIPEVQKIPLPEYRESLDKALKALMDEDMPFNVEFRIRRPDTGEIRDIHSVAEYDRNRNLLFGIVQDISDRKRAEEDLRKNRQFLSDLIEYSGALIFVKDHEGRYEMINRKWEQVTGRMRQDTIGRTDEELFPGPVGRQFCQNDREVMESGSVREMVEFLEDDVHGKRHFLSVKFPVRGDDGTVRGLCGMTTEITERVRAEEALRESMERLRSVSENLADGMVYQIDSGIDGKKRNFTYVSPAVQALHGLTVEEVIENPLLIYHQLDEKYFVFLAESEAEAFAAKSRLDVEVPVHLPSGETRWRRFVSSPRFHENGSVIWDGIELDIHERHFQGEKRRELEERLRRAEKMEALGTLAGGVAHDLNNVLGILVGYSELLLDEIPQDNYLREHIEKILNSGVRAAAIVQDLLTLARRGVHSESVLHLNQVIADCRKTPEYENLMEKHPRIRVEMNLAADLLNIKGSLSHLQKTFMNLLTNAVEAMPEGGQVTVMTANRTLDGPVQKYDDVREGDYVLLSVSDTGEGIPETDMKHIFEPFYTKKVMGRSGTGLGLAVVWGTVKDHRGYIDVRSEVGKGTTFMLYFPVTRQDLAATDVAISLSDYMGNEEAILIVDDIEEQRELASRMLGKLNYRVRSVSSGEAAVEDMKNNPVDLVVLDMIMHPGIDGLDTYKRILEVCPGQRAIIVSGFSATDRVAQAQSLGAGPYIRKPYTLEKLGLAVREGLQKKS